MRRTSALRRSTGQSETVYWENCLCNPLWNFSLNRSVAVALGLHDEDSGGVVRDGKCTPTREITNFLITFCGRSCKLCCPVPGLTTRPVTVSRKDAVCSLISSLQMSTCQNASITTCLQRPTPTHRRIYRDSNPVQKTPLLGG